MFHCFLALLLGLGSTLTQAVESPYSAVSYGQNMASHGTAAVLGNHNYAAAGSPAMMAARAVQQVVYAPASGAFLNQGRALAAGPAYATASLPLLTSSGPVYARAMPGFGYGAAQFLTGPVVQQAGVGGFVGATGYSQGGQARLVAAAPAYNYNYGGHTRLLAASPTYAATLPASYGVSRSVQSLGALQGYAVPASAYMTAAAAPAYGYGGNARVVAMPTYHG